MNPKRSLTSRLECGESVDSSLREQSSPIRCSDCGEFKARVWRREGDEEHVPKRGLYVQPPGRQADGSRVYERRVKLVKLVKSGVC